MTARIAPELLLVALAVVFGALLRWAAARHVPFFDWDAGMFFGRIARDFPAIWSGHGDSQYGARSPVYPMVGLSFATWCVTEVTGMTVAGTGQLLVGLSGLALIPIAWRIARLLAGREAGLIAAMLVACDPRQVEFATQSYNVLPAAAFGALAVAIELGARTRPWRGSAVMAGALCGVAVVLRADALSVGPLLVLLALQRGRPCGLEALVGFAVFAGAAVAFQTTIVERNGAADYLSHVHADMLFNAGLYPDAYFVDETGLTLRIASHPRTIASVWTSQHLLGYARDLVTALARAVGVLVGIALVGVAATGRDGRRTMLLALGVALGPLATAVAAGAPPVDMSRYSLTARPLLLALVSVGVVRSIAAASRSKPLPPWVAVAVVAAVGGVGWSGPLVASSFSAADWRARSETAAAGLARIVPPGARVVRGPGGDTVLLALAGAKPVHMATGPTQEAIAQYFSGNGFEWVVFDARQTAFVTATLRGMRLEAVARYENEDGPQILARVRR